MEKGLLILLMGLISITLDASIHNVRDYGAKGDGVSIDSDSINEAVRAASSEGGGTVYVPSGRYLCYSICLESNICLYLEPGSVLVAAVPSGERGYDLPEEAIDTRYQGFGHIYVRNSLIYGTGLENVTICGSGLIDGTALDSWTEGGAGHGNKALGLRDCRYVTLRDFSIYRGGHFAVHLTAVDNLLIDALHIDSDRDGIDVICCRNVTITGCYVNTPEDDSIVLKSTYTMGQFRDVENVCISDCHISGYKCGTMLDGTRVNYSPVENEYRSGGRIKLGTESSGGYKNVVVNNCTFDHCGGLVLESEDGGNMEDVVISNITMRNVLYCPIFIRLGARMRSPEGTPVGSIRRISISDVSVFNAPSWNACIISGIPGHCIEDVTVRNVTINYSGGFSRKDGRVSPPEFEKDYPEPWMFGTSPASGFFIRHARRVTFDGVKFIFSDPDRRRLFVKKDCRKITVKNITKINYGTFE